MSDFDGNYTQKSFSVKCIKNSENQPSICNRKRRLTQSGKNVFPCYSDKCL